MQTCKCKACGREFTPDYRNWKGQSHCTRKSCQRLRRTLQQKLRRQRALVRPQPPGAPSGKPRRLQEALVISEVDFRAENPVIIGLISMVTGTTDLEQIQKTYRQLWLQGMAIISANAKTISPKKQIISYFERLNGENIGES